MAQNAVYVGGALWALENNARSAVVGCSVLYMSIISFWLMLFRSSLLLIFCLLTLLMTKKNEFPNYNCGLVHFFHLHQYLLQVF